MGERNNKDAKKDKKDIESWLLNFEKLSGPVVVSLLIEKGNIYFCTCTSKNFYPAFANEEEEEIQPIPEQIDTSLNYYVG